ncbi:MAG: hydroxymethylglutaryl-CoA synthase [Gammaproteobacteria bacterium]
MTTVGIDRLYFYTPPYSLPLTTLAEGRGEPTDKYTKGLGQITMGIPSPDEDVVTLAVNAALPLVNSNDVNKVDTLLFATESGVDQSKAAGTYLQSLLNLPSRMRVVELKQACYSATAALQMALAYVRQYPHKQVMVVASDIARYGFNTPGESSQGSGAIAMLVKADPDLLAIEPGSGLHTDDVMDFWRPNYRDEALVDGRHSTKCYLNSLEKTWQHYHEVTARAFHQHDYFCYHVPVPKLVEKAHKHLMRINDQGSHYSSDIFQQQVGASLAYCVLAGNCYSASLYVALLSLLANTNDDLSNKRIGLYSYGSGSVAEYFSAMVLPQYKQYIKKSLYDELLDNRTVLNYKEYQQFYQYALPTDGSTVTIPQYLKKGCRLTGMSEHKRHYALL